MPLVSAADVVLRGLVLKARDYPALSVTGGRIQLDMCQAGAEPAAGVSVTNGAHIMAALGPAGAEVWVG